MAQCAAMSLTPGTQIGPHTIEGAIGAGGIGEVYRAGDQRLNRPEWRLAEPTNGGPPPEPAKLILSPE